MREFDGASKRKALLVDMIRLFDEQIKLPMIHRSYEERARGKEFYIH